MKLNTRFAVLLGLLSAVLLGGVLLLTRAHRGQMRQATLLLQREQAQQLDKLLALTAYPLQQFTRDYSLWDEMVHFVREPEPDWARINLETSVDTFRLAGVWVLNAEGSHIFRTTRGRLGEMSWMLSAESLLPRLKGSPFLHFFVRSGNQLFEVQTAPIQPSSDIQRSSPPRGWLVALRHWDDAALQSLAEISRAQVTLAETAAPTSPPGPGKRLGMVQIQRPLRGLDGAIVGQLNLNYQSQQLVSLGDYGREILLLLALQAAVILAVLTLAFRRWVIAPFRCITESLTRHDTRPVETLAQSPTELGHLARLVTEYFAAEAALKRSQQEVSRALDERVRLGRDLHDGVIQNIYAAGMGLSAAHNMVAREPAAAQAKLDEVRAALNDTIREVRSHIVRLESGEVLPKSFAESCRDAVASLALPASVTCTVEVDETAADRLPIEARTLALQNLRSVVHEAANQRGARRVRIRFASAAGEALLRVTDDGQAPAPAAVTIPPPGASRELTADRETATTFSYSSY